LTHFKELEHDDTIFEKGRAYGDPNVIATALCIYISKTIGFESTSFRSIRSNRQESWSLQIAKGSLDIEKINSEEASSLIDL